MAELTKELKDRVKRGQHWKCKKCGKSIKSGGQIHHKDGNHSNNDIRNLVALCTKCHRQTPTTKKDFWWG